MNQKFYKKIEGLNKAELREVDVNGYTKEERILLDTYTSVKFWSKYPMDIDAFLDYKDEEIIVLSDGRHATIENE
jgi:hypothetical protein